MPDRSVVYRFLGHFGSLNAGLATAGRNTQEFGKKLTALDRDGAKMRAGLDQVGRTAGRVGLVAAGGLAVAIGTAAKFDQAMSAVQAATHETASNMDLLRSAAIKAGADTAYSAAEAANAIEELAKAGISTTDILGGGLSGALNLAAAGAIGVGDAAELAATAMTQFKLSGDQVNHVADLLAAGAGKAQGGVGDLGMALKQGGLVAAQTGLSIEETAGALAQFAANGLIGSDAGTSFKTMLQSLTPSSVKAKEEMERLGISAYDAQGNFVGMANFAGQLQAALGNLSVEQQNAALKTIFGSDAVRAASIIFKDGAAGVEEWQEKVNDAGYAAETAAIRMDNLAGDWEQFTGSLETALIGAGEGSQGPLRKLVQGATEIVNALDAIPAPAKTAGSALAGIVALGGGSIWAGSKIVDGIANMSEALHNLGIEATTARTKVAAIGTAGAAAALGLGTFFDTMSQMDSWSRSQDAADATVKSFQDLSDALEFSNVGKWASDLHINLGRLAQDLAENGEQGEYVQRTLEQLGSDSHGFGALMKSLGGNILPFYTAGADKAYDANKDLKSIIDEMPESLSDQEESVDGAADAVSKYGRAALTSSEANKALQAEWKKNAKAAREQAEAFVGLGDSLNDSKVSLDDWIKQLQEQANALRSFRINAETAAKKGLDEGLIASLRKAGPEGAMRMKQLADGTKQQIDRANASWQSQRREVELTKREIAGVRPPDPITIEVRTFDALTAIERLKIALAQVRSKDVNVNVHYRNIGNRMAGQAQARQNATGGYISGPGTETSDSILSWLSNGEFVMRASAVRRYGADFMAALNAERFADGGQAGDAPRRKGMTVRGRLGDNEYELHVGKSVASATTALVQMRRIVERLNGRLESMNVNVRESERIVKRETRARDRLADRVDAQQAALDDLTGKAWGLASTIREGLSANQFESVAASGNAWDAGTGDRMATFSEIIERLNASTEDSDAFSKAAMVLGGSLSGGALESVLTQGLDTTSMFAKLSPEELAQYQATFDRNVAAKSVAGGIGGGTVYGRDMAKAEQILAASQAELVRQNEALTEANRAANQAERRRDRAEKQRDQARDDRKDIKSELADIRRELAKNRKEAESGSRSRRSK